MPNKIISRRIGNYFFCTLLIANFFSCKQPKEQHQTLQEKPNVILIMADDLGYETLGSNGGTSYQTPNLDLLAQDGMRFEHCYSTPLCTPSRVQLMTGKYNFRNYIGFGLLDDKEKTFGHYMKEAGYKTFIAGKWQLLGNTRQRELAGDIQGTTPEAAGFDEYNLWQIDQRGKRYKDPLISSNEGTEIYEGQFGPDIFVERMETFMDKHQKEPMFIYYPMALTHAPFVPTPGNPGFKDFDAASKVNDTAYFGEMVTYMDKLVGRIRNKVESLGIQDNTLILFIGDNGTDRHVTSEWNGISITGNKGFPTDAGTHVPFIAHWNGKIKAGSVNDNLIDFTDFLPTLMEAATQKTLSANQSDGLSFYNQLLGQTIKTRDWIFCHYEPHWGKFVPRRYVQNRKWKLYGNGELYNLEQDILEKNALDIDKQSSQVQATVNSFKKVLAQYEK
jgi:arylsulfatase A-like enzyme